MAQRQRKIQHARQTRRLSERPRPTILKRVARTRPIPLIGATVAGGTGLAIASIVGAGELIIGAAAAYMTYRVFQRRR